MIRIKNKINKKEINEQIIFIKWVRQKANEDKRYGLIFHIKNEERNIKQRAINKNMGVVSGVPDLFLPYPNSKYFGLFIELKRLKGGVVSSTQKELIDTYNKLGYLAVVAYGAIEAEKIMENYLENQK